MHFASPIRPGIGVLWAAAALLACLPSHPAAAPASAATTICLSRHADTAKGADGQYIDAFTAEGEAQVAALAAKLDMVAPRFDAILVSPAWRAMHSVLPYLREHGRVAEILPELMESSWDASDRDPALAEGSAIDLAGELAEHFQLVAPDYGPLVRSGRVPLAAGPDAGARLVLAANRYLRDRFGGKPVAVLLVGHSLTGSRLLSALQGHPVSPFDRKAPPYRLANGTVSCLVQDPGAQDFRLVRLNDTAPAP